MSQDKLKIKIVYNKDQSTEIEFDKNENYRKIKNKINKMLSITMNDREVEYYFMNESNNERAGYYTQKDHKLFLKQNNKTIYVINKDPEKKTIVFVIDEDEKKEEKKEVKKDEKKVENVEKKDEKKVENVEKKDEKKVEVEKKDEKKVENVEKNDEKKIVKNEKKVTNEKKDTNEIKVDKINKNEDNKIKENIKNDVNKNKIDSNKNLEKLNNKNYNNLPNNDIIIKFAKNLFSIAGKKIRQKFLNEYKGKEKITEYYKQFKIEREKRISNLYSVINEKKFIYKMNNIYNLDNGLFNYEPNYLVDNFLINDNNTNLELNIHDSTVRGSSILNSTENI